MLVRIVIVVMIVRIEILVIVVIIVRVVRVEMLPRNEGSNGKEHGRSGGIWDCIVVYRATAYRNTS